MKTVNIQCLLQGYTGRLPKLRLLQGFSKRLLSEREAFHFLASVKREIAIQSWEF